MRSRTTLTALAVLAVATIGLSGCTSSAATSDQPASGFHPGAFDKTYSGQTVHVMMPPWAKLPDSVISSFEKKTGITIKWETLEFDQLHDKIVTMQAAGTAPADVLEMDSGWVGQFGAAGWDTPLEAFLPAATRSAAVGASAFAYQGKQIAIPYSLDFRGTAYNMTILKKAGIDQVPETYADVIKAATAVKDAGLATYPVGFPLVINDGSASAWYSLVRSSGGEILDKDHKAALTKTSAAEQSLEFLHELYEKHLLDPGSSQLDDGKVDGNFAAGQSAIVLAESPGSLTGYASPTDSRISQDEVVFAHTPGAKGADGPSLGVQEALAIPKASKHKEAAALFITWWLQAGNQAATYANPDGGGGYIPANKAALDELASKNLVVGGEQIVKLLDSIQPVIVNGPPTWYAKFNRQAASTVQNVTFGNLSPKQGVQDLESQIAKMSR